MALSSAGIGSGLDVNSLVSKLMVIERQPITLLETKKTSYNAQLSAYGTLKSSLASLQTAAKALSTPATFSPTKATVADSTILSASASPTAVPGTYDVEVQSLAQSQKLMMAAPSGGGYGDTNTTTLGTGAITINFGTYSSTNPPTFTANSAKPTAPAITIDASNNTLEGIRDAINAAKAGVSATIVNDGSSTGYHLTLTSLDTGARSAMQISVAGDSATMRDLAQLNYDPSSAKAAILDDDGNTTTAAIADTSKMAQNVKATDAVIVVDNVTFTKQTNVITDAIQGVTLNLSKIAKGTTDKVTVAADTSNVKSAIDAFIKAYNDTNTAIKTATAYDAGTRTAAALTGDSTVRSIQSQLRALFTTAVPGAPAGMSVLSDVGISFQTDGSLATDATKFAAALADPSKDMSKLFASAGNASSSRGYAYQMDVLAGKILSPVGTLVNHTNNINTSIKDIGTKEDAINARLVGVEARYRAQFTALDTMMSSMTTTSSFLTQQFNSLTKSA